MNTFTPSVSLKNLQFNNYFNICLITKRKPSKELEYLVQACHATPSRIDEAVDYAVTATERSCKYVISSQQSSILQIIKHLNQLNFT